MHGALELTPLELATGLVIGSDPEFTVAPGNSETPRLALERAILPLLQRPPCVVSFSGGRDSSAVLALATHLARREGFPLPIPATNRFPAVESSDETEWQERVITHLGLDEWVRLEHEDELDCVGPIAQETLARHGLLWPFNAHFHVPLLRAATGGSLLTGIGGDEMLTGPRWPHLEKVFRGRAMPAARDFLRAGFVASPDVVKRRVLRQRASLTLGWLTERGRSEFVDALTRDAAREPAGWARHAAWARRFRYLRVGQESLRVLAADENVQIDHPFLDHGFASALASLPPRERYEDRTHAVRSLFGDLLPGDLLARSSKASFDGAFWSRSSRRFRKTWDGSGVNADYVDADALAEEWERDDPDPRSFLLAQALWLGAARVSERHPAGNRRTTSAIPRTAGA